MSNSICPNCGKSNVVTAYGKDGGKYLLNVETYPSGKSYPRGAHTAAHCEAQKARRAELAEQEAQHNAELVEKEAWMDFRLAAVNAFDASACAEMDALRASGATPEELWAAHEAIEDRRPTPESLRPLYEASKANA